MENQKSVKKKIQGMMSETFAKKLSFKRENVKLKMTYEIERNSESSEIVYGTLSALSMLEKKI